MRSILLVSLAAALALPAASSSAKRERLTDEQQLSKRLAGMSAGKSESCIDLRDAQGTEAIGSTMIFGGSRRTLYRNETRGACGRGYSDDIFVLETYGSRLCRGDVVRTADRYTGMHTGFCILGDFTRYNRAEKARP